MVNKKKGKEPPVFKIRRVEQKKGVIPEKNKK